MIQRIQSIYLLLSGISLSVLLLPIMAFAGLKENSTAQKTLALNDGIINLEDNNISMICTFAGVAMFFAAIFLFKKRALQTKIVALSMVMALIVLIIAVWLIMTYSKLAGNDLNPGIGLGSPVVSIIFGWMANRAIRKDEALVKSMDRLR